MNTDKVMEVSHRLDKLADEVFRISEALKGLQFTLEDWNNEDWNNKEVEE